MSPTQPLLISYGPPCGNNDEPGEVNRLPSINVCGSWGSELSTLHRKWREGHDDRKLLSIAGFIEEEPAPNSNQPPKYFQYDNLFRAFDHGMASVRTDGVLIDELSKPIAHTPTGPFGDDIVAARWVTAAYNASQKNPGKHLAMFVGAPELTSCHVADVRVAALRAIARDALFIAAEVYLTEDDYPEPADKLVELFLKWQNPALYGAPYEEDPPLQNRFIERQMYPNFGATIQKLVFTLKFGRSGGNSGAYVKKLIDCCSNHTLLRNGLLGIALWSPRHVHASELEPVESALTHFRQVWRTD